MAYLPSLGKDATMVDVYRHYPEVARHVLGLAQAAFGLTDEFTPGECEMIGAYVSALNNCGYCRRVHMEAAVAAGLDRSLFDGHAIGDAPKYGDEKWRPVFDYVKAVTLSSSAIFKGQVEKVLEAGWSEDAVMQIVVICSAFSVLNRFANGLGLTATDDFFEAMGYRLATDGYTGATDLLGM